jgi:NADH-quinone oxidoreductase subunit J
MPNPFLLAADSSPAKVDWLTKCATCPTCWALIVGSFALWLLVPGGQTKKWARTLGGFLAALSGLLFAVDLPPIGDWNSHLGTQIVFWALAAVTLGSGVAMIAARSPVYSALWFAQSLVGTAGLFLMQNAQFLGVATIVVYAGAIVVTFLFVIMLASPEGTTAYDRVSWGWFPRPAAILAAAVLIGILASATSGLKNDAIAKKGLQTEAIASGPLGQTHMANLGRELFSAQLVAVEVAGALLMAALVGAIAVAMQAKTPSRTEGAR